MGHLKDRGRRALSQVRKSKNKKLAEKRREKLKNIARNVDPPISSNEADVSLDNLIEQLPFPLQALAAERVRVLTISETDTTKLVSVKKFSDKNVIGSDVTVNETVNDDILAVNTNVDHPVVIDKNVDVVQFVTSAELYYETVTASKNVEDAILEANDSLKSDCTAEAAINGRQIVDIVFILREINRTFDDHAEKTGCRFRDWKLVKSRRRGFLTQMFFRCEKCNHEENIWSEPANESTFDVNAAAVLGTMTTGIGFSQLEELFAAMQVECMSEKTYIKYRGDTTDMLERTADSKMKEAAELEKKLAIENGDVLEDGTPLIGVITDGMWAKRSYGSNYNSLSGLGLIIGLRTGKPVFIGIRNKFCTVCDIVERRGSKPKPHKCYKNFDRNASSTKMESDAIVEGFVRSLEMYGLIYNKVIADGDSNLIKAIRDKNPYHKHGVQVQKVECTNHLLRNLCRKITEVSKVTQLKGHRKDGFVAAKAAIKSKTLAIRREVVAASKRWSEDTQTGVDRARGLRHDILNICSHVFGDHKRCRDRECQTDKRASKQNIVPALKAHGLYQRVFQSVEYISCFADSLIVQETNNPAESCNAVVCKTIGGKRINFGLRDSYNGRVSAALMQFNSQQVLTDCYESAGMTVPHAVKKLEEKRKIKRENTSKARQDQGRKRGLRKTQGLDKYYGQNSQKPDLEPAMLELLEKEHSEELAENAANWKQIEFDTREQSGSEVWQTLRRRMLTASNFGAVCRMRDTTSCARQVEAILFPSIPDVPALRYGRDQEEVARAQLAVVLEKEIGLAGLFIDREHHFLGASPDGLIDEDGLVEIKCPLTAKNLTLQEAAAAFKNMNGVFDKKNDQRMNRIHKYFYQVQGQLHITRRAYCIFAVWSPNYMKYIRVERDDTFWKGCMVNKLKEFYDECMIPEIIDSRHNRSMRIRDSEKIVKAKAKAKLNKIAKEKEKLEAPNDVTERNEARKRRLSETVIAEDDDELYCLGETLGTGLSAEDAIRFRQWFDDARHRPEDIRANVESLGSRLNDDSLDTFMRIVREKYDYVTQSVHYINSPFPTMIDPVTNQRSIQIFGGTETDHWRCLSFDGSKLRIYDSLGGAERNKLTDKEQKYIGLRYPTIGKTDISYENVQHQPPGVSCGIYASAYATSIVLGRDPCYETFSTDEKVMRQHFVQIIESGSLVLFPRK